MYILVLSVHVCNRHCSAYVCVYTCMYLEIQVHVIIIVVRTCMCIYMYVHIQVHVTMNVHGWSNSVYMHVHTCKVSLDQLIGQNNTAWLFKQNYCNTHNNRNEYNHIC